VASASSRATQNRNCPKKGWARRLLLGGSSDGLPRVDDEIVDDMAVVFTVKMEGDLEMKICRCFPKGIFGIF
jgi:hypothetical protein